MTEPLYTADEMRAAEAGHDVPTLMERAGRAVADAVLERFPARSAIVGVCGGGANGGDGRIALNLLEGGGPRRGGVARASRAPTSSSTRSSAPASPARRGRRRRR